MDTSAFGLSGMVGIAEAPGAGAPGRVPPVLVRAVAGDFISANGTGNLHVNYYNKGEFKMFGTYTINRGIYKLSMQEIIRKDFALNQGGTVSFSGDPYHANVNV